MGALEPIGSYATMALTGEDAGLLAHYFQQSEQVSEFRKKAEEELGAFTESHITPQSVWPNEGHESWFSGLSNKYLELLRNGDLLEAADFARHQVLGLDTEIRKVWMRIYDETLDLYFQLLPGSIHEGRSMVGRESGLAIPNELLRSYFQFMEEGRFMEAIRFVVEKIGTISKTEAPSGKMREEGRCLIDPAKSALYQSLIRDLTKEKIEPLNLSYIVPSTRGHHAGREAKFRALSAHFLQLIAEGKLHEAVNHAKSQMRGWKTYDIQEHWFQLIGHIEHISAQLSLIDISMGNSREIGPLRERVAHWVNILTIGYDRRIDYKGLLPADFQRHGQRGLLSLWLEIEKTLGNVQKKVLRLTQTEPLQESPL